jgi:hypothetical protein
MGNGKFEKLNLTYTPPGHVFPAFCASVPAFARSSTVIALAIKLAASFRFEGMIRVLPALASSLNAPT